MSSHKPKRTLQYTIIGNSALRQQRSRRDHMRRDIILYNIIIVADALVIRVISAPSGGVLGEEERAAHHL